MARTGRYRSQRPKAPTRTQVPRQQSLFSKQISLSSTQAALRQVQVPEVTQPH
jgi:hypothetical protein